MEKNMKNFLALVLLATIRVLSIAVSFVMLSIALCSGSSIDPVQSLLAPLVIAVSLAVISIGCGNRMKSLKPAAIPGFDGGMPPAVPVAA